MKTIKKAKTKIKRYAFWKYDLFPYMLSGEIIGKCKGKWPGPDYYEIAGYGRGYYFRPFLIIGGTKGKKLMEDVRRITNEYRLAQHKTKIDFANILLELNPEFKNVVSVIKV